MLELEVVTTGSVAACVRCFHPKAACHNHVAVSGLAAALAMPSIFVDLLLLHSLFSFGAAGASVNAPAFSIALGDFFFVHRLFIRWAIFSGAGLLFFMLWRAHVVCPLFRQGVCRR